MKNKLPCYFIPVCMCLCPLLLSGCVEFYHYKTIPIKVIDPELNQPVEGVLASLKYSLIGRGLFLPKSPKDTTGTTDRNGIAMLKVATNFEMYLGSISCSAEGYIPVSLMLPFQSENVNEIIVPLYRIPLPRIELIVPDDYQGPVAIQIIQSNEWVMGEPGQRLFTYQLQNNGQLDIRITPVFSLVKLIGDIKLHRLFSTDSDDCMFIVKRENGSNMIRVGREYEWVIQFGGQEQKVESDRRAFRWVWDEGRRFLFVIGTEQDRDVLYKKLFPENRFGLDRDAFNAFFQEPEK